MDDYALIAVIACVVATAAAYTTVLNAPEGVAVWPIRLWLWLSRHANIRGLRTYAGSRRVFSRREQFLATFFAWFFIIFANTVFWYQIGIRGPIDG
jgi:hypothetical protein